MQNTSTFSRRHLLQATAAASTIAIAGCGGSAPSNDEDDSTDADDGSDTDDSDGTDDTQDTAEFDGWFDDVENYDGVIDETGTDSITVTVGSGNGLLFNPPAVRVSPGTTVTWEWSGEGGEHNVAAENGDFESETTDEQGFTFEQTFDEVGNTRYACTPHRATGMKGIVIVE